VSVFCSECIGILTLGKRNPTCIYVPDLRPYDRLHLLDHMYSLLREALVTCRDTINFCTMLTPPGRMRPHHYDSSSAALFAGVVWN
jgi:hypothetical protein